MQTTRFEGNSANRKTPIGAPANRNTPIEAPSLRGEAAKSKFSSTSLIRLCRSKLIQPAQSTF